MSADAASTAFSMIAFILAGSASYFGLVEHDLELLGVLVVALQHADLGNVREAEDAIRGGVVEFGRIEQAAIHRRHDLAAGQCIDRRAHAGEHVNRQADSAELQPLDSPRIS